MRYLVVILLLSACGFKPVYKKNGDIYPQLAMVYIEPIIFVDNQNIAQILQRELQQDIEHNNKYRLVITPSKDVQKLAIRADRHVERYNIILSAKYELWQDKEMLKSGSLQRSGAFNTPDNEYGLLRGEEDILQKAAYELADDIKMQLIMFLSANADK